MCDHQGSKVVIICVKKQDPRWLSLTWLFCGQTDKVPIYTLRLQRRALLLDLDKLKWFK